MLTKYIGHAYLNGDPALLAVRGDGGEDDKLDGIELDGVKRGVGAEAAEEASLHVLDAVLRQLKWDFFSSYGSF